MPTPKHPAATVAPPTDELVAAAEWFMEVACPAGKEYEAGQRLLYWQARDRLKAALAAVKGDHGMTQIECFLVLGKKKRAEPEVRRVTQRRPALQPDEALVRLSLDLPADVFDAPLLTVPIAKRQVAVAVEVDEPVDEPVCNQPTVGQVPRV